MACENHVAAHEAAVPGAPVAVVELGRERPLGGHGRGRTERPVAVLRCSGVSRNSAACGEIGLRERCAVGTVEHAWDRHREAADVARRLAPGRRSVSVESGADLVHWPIRRLSSEEPERSAVAAGVDPGPVRFVHQRRTVQLAGQRLALIGGVDGGTREGVVQVAVHDREDQPVAEVLLDHDGPALRHPDTAHDRKRAGAELHTDAVLGLGEDHSCCRPVAGTGP